MTSHRPIPTQTICDSLVGSISMRAIGSDISRRMTVRASHSRIILSAHQSSCSSTVRTEMSTMSLRESMSHTCSHIPESRWSSVQMENSLLFYCRISMIIDTHSHCYWKNLAPRLDEIIANMRISQVQKAVQIGCDIPTSQQAIDLAKRFPQTFFATV